MFVKNTILRNVKEPREVAQLAEAGFNYVNLDRVLMRDHQRLQEIKKVKEKYPDVAWNEMKGMRNFISHEYFGLQLDSVWFTAVNDIPTLKEQIQKIISDLS